MFNKKRTVKISYDKEKQAYKIVFYSDILESGGFEEDIIDYYKTEQDVIDNKIYINFYKEKK